MNYSVPATRHTHAYSQEIKVKQGIFYTPPQTMDMVHPEWLGPPPYTNQVWATEWHTLFPADDARNTLTWRDRFPNLPLTNIYNFYSSGEDVLRDDTNYPPPDTIAALFAEAKTATEEAYVWTWQEKDKGRLIGNRIIGSNHGGWKFNDASYGTNIFIDFQSSWIHMSPAAAAELSTNQLLTNAFFSFSSDLDVLPSEFFTADAALQGANGAAYAQTNRNRILADAIPALTLPVGANPVPGLDQPGDTHNFNMQALYENNWPANRMSTSETNNWNHSDFRQVSYTFTYPLFTNFVGMAHLK